MHLTSGTLVLVQAGDARLMDTRPDEQDRGITIKSTGISLYYQMSDEALKVQALTAAVALKSRHRQTFLRAILPCDVLSAACSSARQMSVTHAANATIVTTFEPCMLLLRSPWVVSTQVVQLRMFWMSCSHVLSGLPVALVRSNVLAKRLAEALAATRVVRPQRRG